MHANAFENHESSNGEEPALKTPPSSTPPPPVSGYAVAAGAQQNHVDSRPISPPASTVPSRIVNHVSSTAPTMPSSILRPGLLTGNGVDQSVQSNHLPGQQICLLLFHIIRSWYVYTYTFRSAPDWSLQRRGWELESWPDCQSGSLNCDCVVRTCSVCSLPFVSIE